MRSVTIDLQAHPNLQFRIDGFSVPGASRSEFEAAMRRNLTFLETLPGFLGHVVFEKTTGPSTLDIVTIALWDSQEAIAAAGEKVRAYSRCSDAVAGALGAESGRRGGARPGDPEVTGAEAAVVNPQRGTRHEEHDRNGRRPSAERNVSRKGCPEGAEPPRAIARTAAARQERRRRRSKGIARAGPGNGIPPTSREPPAAR